MADLGTKQNWLASPTREIEEKWIDVQIQERRSRIAKTKQDIEDLERGTKVKLQAQIMMLEREMKELEREKGKITIVDAEINKEA